SAVTFWDVATGTRRAALPMEPGWVRAVAYAPDGQALAVLAGERVTLWDLTRNEQRDAFPAYHPMALSADGGTLATAAGGPAGVRLGDVATGREVGSLSRYAAGLFALAVAPDGRTLAAGQGDGVVQLWDGPTGRLRATLEGHAEPVSSVAFSPDGRV